MKKYLILMCFLFISTYMLHAATLTHEDQIDIEALKKTAPKIFIDCGFCDIDYIRTEITFVNYVRDRKEAQIHILITSRTTGGGGREYTIAYLGQNEFEGTNDTQKYFSKQTETSDEIREGLAKSLKIGLMSYVAKTPIASRLKISYTEQKNLEEVRDKWNKWVYRISGGGHLSGEKSYKYQSLRSSFSASRITEDSKINLSLSANQSQQTFDFEDESLKSSTESYYFSGQYVFSLNDHWSIGAFLRSDSSTYENVDISISIYPAIEFNLFPYHESTRRQLNFLYRIGMDAVRYREVTIYEKTSERLLKESLSVSLSLKEKWGSISTTLAGSHYLHDFKMNRITFFNIVNLRIYKGLNLFAFGGGSRIHDQLALVKGEANLEEILLRRKQLETSYDYFFSIGFSYTFGSIFTNVVNPRFGSSGSGGISIIIE